MHIPNQFFIITFPLHSASFLATYKNITIYCGTEIASVKQPYCTVFIYCLEISISPFSNDQRLIENPVKLKSTFDTVLP